MFDSGTIQAQLKIKHETRYYPFLVSIHRYESFGPSLDDSIRVYWPDFNGKPYGKNHVFELVLSMRKLDRPDIHLDCQSDPKVYSQSYWYFDETMLRPCKPFRYMGQFYRQYIEIQTNAYGWSGDDIWYVALNPIKELPGNAIVPNNINGWGYIVRFYEPADGIEADTDMVGCQSFAAQQMDLNYVYINISDNTLETVSSWTESAIDTVYSKTIAECRIDIQPEIALADSDNIYWKLDREDGGVGSDAGIRYSWDVRSFPFTSNSQWVEGMRLVSIVHTDIYNLDVSTTEPQMQIDFRSNDFPVTQEVFARLLALKNGMSTLKVKTVLNNVNVDKVRVVNKTIQKVVELTSMSDSKSNIIQPVFFRVRDLAQIIVHPAVTENICINLDAYKSQVDRFYIKIEGITFAEIGRTEAGIIFKVQGNLLPGTLTAGTYYILDESATLVTTGKYKYES